MAITNKPASSGEICLLAGGLSSRLGRDKARLRLGRKTLLGHIRSVAKKLDCPCRIIRRDLVPRCGPLGGIYTALQTTKADAVLFLACDMPFVSEKLLRKIMNRSWPTHATFTQSDSAGFPFVLPRAALSTVTAQLARKEFSLQKLAQRLQAKILQPSRAERELLFNVNTPQDWVKARHQFRSARRETAGAKPAAPCQLRSPTRHQQNDLPLTDQKTASPRVR